MDWGEANARLRLQPVYGYTSSRSLEPGPLQHEPFLYWETTGMSKSAMQPHRVEEYKYGLCILKFLSGGDMLPQLQDHCKEIISHPDQVLF